jgi:hypothetical protein
MLGTVTPVQFHAGASSGKTKPSRNTCEKPVGTLVEVMTKFSSVSDRKEIALAMEVVAACLPDDLGLPDPAMFIGDGIKNKARKSTGHLAAVSDAPDRFKPYFIVGAPHDNKLPAYRGAAAILRKSPMRPASIPHAV